MRRKMIECNDSQIIYWLLETEIENVEFEAIILWIRIFIDAIEEMKFKQENNRYNLQFEYFTYLCVLSLCILALINFPQIHKNLQPVCENKFLISDLWITD